jgi:tetratricopeptide (TPR) repeat protein
MLTMQPSNSAAVTNGGGMFRITNAPTGQQALIIDPNTIPPDFELKSEPSLQVSIKQGEVTNNLEFVLAKKVRPVKKVVFGGISTVKVSEASAMPASVSPKAAANKPVPGSSRVVTPRPGSVPAPAVSGPKLSPSEIDALYKEGSKLFSSGDYQGALKMWQKILSSEPGHASAKRNLERTRQKLEAQRKAKG